MQSGAVSLLKWLEGNLGEAGVLARKSNRASGVSGMRAQPDSSRRQAQNVQMPWIRGSPWAGVISVKRGSTL